jgi:anti-sigma factor RsiW
MSEHDRFRDDCGAYVLGALEEHEAAALREHLDSCVRCRDEVERLAAVAEVLRESGTQGVLVLTNLPPAPRNRIYEVWVRRGGRARPTSVLFDATSAGRATVAVPDLTGASAVMVTAERLGGASVPTMAPLIVAVLS